MKSPSAAWPTLIAALLILAILAGLAAPFIRKARAIGRLDSCAGNLRRLYTMKEQCYILHRRTMKVDEPVGKAYWAQLSQVDPRYFEGLEKGFLECPAREPSGTTRIDRLGPPRQMSHIADSGPLGCDEEETHGDREHPTGLVLRKAGDLREVSGKDWISIHTERKCIP